MSVEWIDKDGHHVDDDGKRPRKQHTSDKNKKEELWLSYRPGKGYVWGPDHPLTGQAATFGVEA